VRTVDDIRGLLRAGADKVCINTAAIRRPELIGEAARIFGTQCVVVAVEAIRQTGGRWKAFTDNGREHTNLDACEWALRAVELGAGELLLTSVDREGTRKGFDLDFIGALAGRVGVPVVAHGGAGSVDDIIQVARLGVDGVALASILHYGVSTVGQIKDGLAAAGIKVRR
jgi:cyclase